ncbi:GNAT family N-acetyltransferase [Streptomyces sp. NPDC006733]|uniref:GNAT family N-acetyltransferase n=1 Tax=Streptomyces sp. NPDC006733 TaxID=3155460 RepID=UPI0033F1A1C6
MQIRAAQGTEADILSALALRSKAHWGYDAAFMAACVEELTMRADEITCRRTTVAEQDGRIVGFTTLEGRPPTGVLGMMFVDPHAMGQGIGRLLFEHLRANARQLRFAQITIDADPQAEPFYRAMGAVRTGSIPSGSIAGRMLPQLLLALQPQTRASPERS